MYRSYAIKYRCTLSYDDSTAGLNYKEVPKFGVQKKV